MLPDTEVCTKDTQGVAILTGDPKKAILSLSVPMIIDHRATDW
ncbi:MAG: hypothetical protein ABSE07_00335 [Methanoregula sp.]|jgi:hypothetical protein